MKKSPIKNLAKKIIAIEKQISLGENVQENKDKIENIIMSLSFEEVLSIDEYICCHDKTKEKD